MLPFLSHSRIIREDESQPNLEVVKFQLHGLKMENKHLFVFQGKENKGPFLN